MVVSVVYVVICGGVCDWHIVTEYGTSLSKLD